jgi:hypothetical protein
VTETETGGHEASKVTYGRVKATGLGQRVRLGVGFCATWQKQGQRGGVLGVVRRWAAWWQGREAPSNVARLDMARSMGNGDERAATDSRRHGCYMQAKSANATGSIGRLQQRSELSCLSVFLSVCVCALVCACWCIHPPSHVIIVVPR